MKRILNKSDRYIGQGQKRNWKKNIYNPSPKNLTFFFFKIFSIFEQKKSNFFLESVEIHMRDVESTESKEKSNIWFSRFLFFELWLFLVIFVPHFFFLYPITRKIDDLFVWAHCASSVKTGSKLRGGGQGGSAYP